MSPELRVLSSLGICHDVTKGKRKACTAVFPHTHTHPTFSLVLTPSHRSPEHCTFFDYLFAHHCLSLWTLIYVPLHPGTVGSHRLFPSIVPSSWVPAPLPLPRPPGQHLCLPPAPSSWHCLFPGHCPLPDTISDTHTAHPPGADPTLCSILLWTLIENAEGQQAVPLWRRDVSSYSGFSSGPAREKRPLSPRARLPGEASPAPRPPFPLASHSFLPYLQSPAP